jgi:hypothetical protein
VDRLDVVGGTHADQRRCVPDRERLTARGRS